MAEQSPRFFVYFRECTAGFSAIPAGQWRMFSLNPMAGAKTMDWRSVSNQKLRNIIWF